MSTVHWITSPPAIHTISTAPIPQGELSAAPEWARTLPSPAAAQQTSQRGQNRQTKGSCGCEFSRRGDDYVLHDRNYSPVETNPFSPGKSCSGAVTGRGALGGALTWNTLGRTVSSGSTRSACMRGDVGHPSARHRDNFPLMASNLKAPQGPLFGEGDCGWLRALFAWGRGRLFHRNCSGAVATTCIRWLTHDRVLKWQVHI